MNSFSYALDNWQQLWLSGLLLVALIALVLLYSPSASERKAKREATPVGYKQASLYSTGLDKPFEGVGQKTRYGLVDETSTKLPGFHSFYRLEDALRHHQNGTVILEVVASGKIRLHEVGMRSTQQRVLQIIVAECAMDPEHGQATHFAGVKTEEELPLVALCAPCTASLSTISPLVAEANHLTECWSLEEFHSHLKTVTGRTVLIRQLGGKQEFRFIPTVAEPIRRKVKDSRG